MMRAWIALVSGIGGVVALAGSVSVSSIWIPALRMGGTAFDDRAGEVALAILIVTLALIAVVSIWIAVTTKLASIGTKALLAGASFVAALTVPAQIVVFEVAGFGAYSAGYEGGANDGPAIVVFWLLVVAFTVVGVWGFWELRRKSGVGLRRGSAAGGTPQRCSRDF